MLTIHQTRGELNTIENKKSENRVDRGGWVSVDWIGGTIGWPDESERWSGREFEWRGSSLTLK